MSQKSKVQKAIEHIYAHPGCRSDALAAIFMCETKNVQAYMAPVLNSGLIIACKVERPGKPTINEYKPSSAAPDKCPDNWLDWKRINAPQPVKPLKFKATGPRDGVQKSGSARETQAGSGDVTPAVAAGSSPLGTQHLPSSEAAIEEQAGSHGPEEATASASVPAASAKQEKSDLLQQAESLLQEIRENSSGHEMPVGIFTPVETPQAECDQRIARLSELDLFATLGLSGAMTIQFKGETMHLPVSAVRELGKFMIATEPAWA